MSLENSASSESCSLKVRQPVLAKGLFSKLDLLVQKWDCSWMGGLFEDSDWLTPLPVKWILAQKHLSGNACRLRRSTQHPLVC
jgi:hypothetical protein